MTSSWTCHVCGQIAHSFHYTKPFTGDGHHGYWHCAEHGPKSEAGEEVLREARSKDPTHGMNRAERRAAMRRKKR